MRIIESSHFCSSFCLETETRSHDTCPALLHRGEIQLRLQRDLREAMPMISTMRYLTLVPQTGRAGQSRTASHLASLDGLGSYPQSTRPQQVAKTLNPQSARLQQVALMRPTRASCTLPAKSNRIEFYFLQGWGI